MPSTPSSPGDELCFQSAVELAAAIRAKKVSPVEVTEAVLDRIERLNPKLNAFSTLLADDARRAAHEAETALIQGEPLGPLHGVPVSVKDIMSVKDVRTTYGSKLYEQNVTPEDAPAVERLRRAGAVIIGRTNTPEFGWKGVTDNRLFGITRNPWNAALTPGGSSGGASAAVAAGLGPIGIGSDGGGSVRIPAAFCGVVGLKASLGRVPTWPGTGVDSLRHIGPLTRTVADTALALDVMAGPDERDPGSLPAAPAEYLARLEEGIRGQRIAYSADLGYAQVELEVAQICSKAVQRFAEAGAVVNEAKLAWHDPYDCWTVFFYGGIAARLFGLKPERLDLLDPGLRPVIERGLKLTAVNYVNALVNRNTFWQQARQVFDSFDLLVTPTMAVSPFAVGLNRPKTPGKDGGDLRWSPFTYAFNLTGQPAVSVPCGWTQAGLPVGLQIVGRRFADLAVLRAARAWEQLEPWVHRRPELT